MRRKLALLVALLALVLGGLVATSGPVSAHTVPGDSTPGAEHNLCVWFRPYGVGEVIDHNRIDGQNRVCFWRGPANSIGNHSCYWYWIRWGVYGVPQWSGPYDVQIYDFDC